MKIKTSFSKHPSNPLYGNSELGTCFDVYVTKENGKYRMDFSKRRDAACAVTFSDDGIVWSAPILTLEPDFTSGWEDRLNRNCVLKIDGKYRMWYTGQKDEVSKIGIAESDDGIHFYRIQREPILQSDYPWEGVSVMNPCVIFENGVYRMWYSAGENYEPNVLAYAESRDGIHFEKRAEPIFVCNPENVWEQDRIGGCHVVPTEDMDYLLFYIGYADIDTARIGVARSKDGITNWERSPLNPLVGPDAGMWDADATYKPSAMWEPELGKWRIWYNGRREHDEYVGMADYSGRNLFPKN